MEKKYKLTEESICFDGTTLYRIEAIRDFGHVSKGEKGGFVETERNLSHVGDAWVYGDAKVCGDAKVYGDAEVCGNAWVCGDAKVYGTAWVCGDAKVYGTAWVCGNAEVYGNAEVCGNAEVYGDAKVYCNADYIVFKNWWSSGRYFTWTRSNNMWSVGCFLGTGKELIKKAYKDSDNSGREYERVVKYVESILADEKEDK